MLFVLLLNRVYCHNRHTSIAYSQFGSCPMQGRTANGVKANLRRTILGSYSVLAAGGAEAVAAGASSFEV